MADKNEPPQIPSFKSGKKDDDKKGGALSNLGKPSGSAPSMQTPPSSGIKWPSLGAKGSPNLKVRGLPGGATILDRLKNLRRKDMGFIAAGLSVLMMAPVAEHLMMAPEDAKRGDLTAGFDQKGPLFPDGTTIYENGTGGFSPGSLIGAGSDVITPLNVRDPAALVMGPGATQKPAATATPPAPKPPEEKSNWKDALSQAASRGARTAVNKAKLPKPNVKMSGALRGLSALSGSSSGGGPSMKLDTPNAGNVPNRARASNSLSRAQAIPGYQGAARRSNASSGSPESLRSAGGSQGSLFNRGGAANALDQAAATNIPSGGFGHGGGGPGSGAGGKGPGGNNAKDSRSLGESLAYQRLKKEQDKAIDLKWKIKEWETFGRKKMIEEAVYKSAIENLLGKGIFEPLGGALAAAVKSMNPDGSVKGVTCHVGGQSESFKNSDTQSYECVGGKEVYTIIKSKEGNRDRKLYKTCDSCGYFGGAKTEGPTNDNSRRNDEAATIPGPGNQPPHRGTGAAGAIDRAVTGNKTWADAEASLRTAAQKLDKIIQEADQLVKSGDAAGNALLASARTLKEKIESAAKLHKEAREANEAALGKLKAAKDDLGAALTKLGGDDGKGGLLKGERDALAAAEKLFKEISGTDYADLSKKKFDTTDLLNKGTSVEKFEKLQEIDGAEEKLSKPGDSAQAKLKTSADGLDKALKEHAAVRTAQEDLTKRLRAGGIDKNPQAKSEFELVGGIVNAALSQAESFGKAAVKETGKTLVDVKGVHLRTEHAQGALLLEAILVGKESVTVKYQGIDAKGASTELPTQIPSEDLPNIKPGGQGHTGIAAVKTKPFGFAQQVYALASDIPSSTPAAGKKAGTTPLDEAQFKAAVTKAEEARKKASAAMEENGAISKAYAQARKELGEIK